uniref:Uncharacterized protein n=1 Tax=Arundo donax TaxID=35708 RepID=A0A0A8YCQ8_ARUDO
MVSFSSFGIDISRHTSYYHLNFPFLTLGLFF